MNALRTACRRPLLRALLLLVLVARAATPAGVMTTAGEQGLTVQMCTASGLQSLVLPTDPLAPQGDTPHQDPTCLAALAAGAALAPPLAFPPVAAAALREAPPPAASRAALASIVRAQSPRGPPYSPASC